jgi:double-strand break repair protein MRE11
MNVNLMALWRTDVFFFFFSFMFGRHVGILEVQDKDFSLLPIPLKSVRPFIFDDIVLAEHEEEAKLKLDEKPKVVRYLKSLVSAQYSSRNPSY